MNELTDQLLKTLEKNPEKDIRLTWSAMKNGEYGQCVPLQILRQPAAEERRAAQRKLSLAQRLRNNLKDLLAYTKLENPIAPSLETGFGAGTMATIFGAKLDLENNAYPDMPVEHLALKKFEHFERPAISEAGLFPLIKQQIDFYKEHTPAEVLISPPNLQSPFNTLHTIVGSDLFVEMSEYPDQVHHLMQMITDALIEAILLFEKWIGPDRLSPSPGFSYCIASIESRCMVSECSCNLISPDYYREFVLPYDRQLDAHFNPLAFHPCSGRHVFDVTLKSFSDLSYTEAGWIECDPNTKSVEQAIEDIGDRPAILYVREELPKGKEEQRIREVIDLAKRRGRMYLSFTGMHWTPKDDAYIIDLHRKMDAYFYDS